jgi:hypothetical protein
MAIQTLPITEGQKQKTLSLEESHFVDHKACQISPRN